MNPTILLNNTNYLDSTLTQGKVFNIPGSSYATNYPLLDSSGANIVDVSINTGDTHIIASSGFLQLLGCDIQNNNKPIYPFIVTDDTGCLFEIDYVISDTEAVLKAPSSYSAGFIAGFILNTLTPSPISTVVSDISGAGVSTIINTKFGPGASFALFGSLELGTAPVIIYMTANIQMSITY